MVEFVASGSRTGGGALVVGNVADRAGAGLGRAGQPARLRESWSRSAKACTEGAPSGRPEWQKPIAKRLGLESAYRLSGRPPKIGRLESSP